MRHLSETMNLKFELNTFGGVPNGSSITFLSKGFSNDSLNLFKRLCRLHPIIPYPFKPFRKYMLNHPPYKRIHIHSLFFYPLCLIQPIMISYCLPVTCLRATHRQISIYPPYAWYNTVHPINSVPLATLTMMRGSDSSFILRSNWRNIIP